MGRLTKGTQKVMFLKNQSSFFSPFLFSETIISVSQHHESVHLFFFICPYPESNMWSMETEKQHNHNRGLNITLRTIIMITPLWCTHPSKIAASQYIFIKRSDCFSIQFFCTKFHVYVL